MVDDPKTKHDGTKTKENINSTILPLPLQVAQREPQSETAENTQNSSQQKPNRLLKVLRALRKRHRDSPKWTDKAIVLLTGGIVFLAFMQWWEMHDAGTQTDKIIAADERIAKAMEGALAQSIRSLDASIEMSRNDQRAWVGISGISLLKSGRKL